ncbi:MULTISPECIES: hypothetical protein [unclassified Microbacterium]|uniref:hypothetical protein n=1 Tax=unclassified Microbacterium TaxID=2609290 RepID=UPI002882D91C|nr:MULTISPECIES: hypothetical protein [unclassified Microbacterium]
MSEREETLSLDRATLTPVEDARYEDTTQTVADLDGSDDEATWLQPGYVLEREDVDYIRSLVLPASVRSHPKL